MDALNDNNFLINRAIGVKGVMPELFKFYPIWIRYGHEETFNDYLLESIRDHYLWHSDIQTLNDPFELVDFSNPSDAYIKRFINDRFRSSRRSKREEIAKLRKDPKSLIEALKQGYPKFRICCFTNSQMSNVMWSHYANRHTGLCLRFDNLQLIRQNITALKVAYDQFISTNFFQMSEQALVNQLTTKSIEWDYENEYRTYTTSQNKVAYNRDCLTGVIFGCKTKSEDIALIQKHFESSGFTNIEWLQAQMQSRSFDMIIKPLI